MKTQFSEFHEKAIKFLTCECFAEHLKNKGKKCNSNSYLINSFNDSSTKTDRILKVSLLITQHFRFAGEVI